MSASPKEARKAKSYLRRRAKASSRDIPPRKFAAAAKESNVRFDGLMKFISQLYAGGQDRGTFREAALRTHLEKAR